MKEELNEINLKADKNNNDVPDWLEALATYIIAGACLAMAIHGYAVRGMSIADIQWLLGFAAALSANRDRQTGRRIK